MDRRTFLRTSSAAAAATAATTAAASSVQNARDDGGPVPEAPSLIQARHELAIGISRQVATQQARYAVDDLLQSIRTASADRIVITPVEFDGSSFAGLASGELDGAVSMAGDGVSDHPELAFFSGLPGRNGLSPEHLYAWVATAGGALHWQDVLADFELTARLAGHTGKSVGLWASREIETARELRDARLATYGLGAQVARQLGITLAPSTAEADAAEVPANVTEAAAFAPIESPRVWYREGLHGHGAATALLLKTQVWERLGDADRLMIDAIAAAQFTKSLAQAATHARLVAPSLFAAKKIRQAPLANDVAQGIEFAANSVIEAAALRNEASRRMFESYNKFAQTMTGVPVLASGARRDIGVV